MDEVLGASNRSGYVVDVLTADVRHESRLSYSPQASGREAQGIEREMA